MASLDGGKKYACKYRVNTLVLSVGSTSMNLDASNILSIEYLNDYDFNIRAELKISIRVDIRRKIWIINNKRDLTVKFELSKVGMDIDSETFITTEEEVLNGNFTAYLNDEDESSDTKAMEERINMNEGSQFAANSIQEENYFETQNVVDLYLFNQQLLNASNNGLNTVFTKDILQNCVSRMLTATGHKSVLMSKFENDEVYEELVLPSLSSYEALIYLDQYYGFYKTGAMIYYDLDTLYVLNSNGRLTAKRPNECPTTCMYVTSLDNSQPGNGMIRVSGSNISYVSVSEMNVNPQKPSISNNETIGSEAKLVVSDDITIDVASADQSFINQRNGSTLTIQKSDNKFMATILRARMEENEAILYFNGENIDLSAFTPNKEFQIIFEETSKNQKYGQYEYRLSYAYHYIRMRSSEYMDSSHLIILKRSASNE